MNINCCKRVAWFKYLLLFACSSLSLVVILTHYLYTGCVSESGDFATLFFSGGNTGADAAMAILLPNLKRFSCNGAVDWSTKCFCCENILQQQ